MGDMKARLIGLAVVAVGVALAWYFGFKPLEEARAGAQEGSYSIKMFLVAPMAIVFGLFLLIGGARVADVAMEPPRTRRQRLIVWPLFALALAAGGHAWWWLDAQLGALGYQ
jgi:hypothetical protein